jgi:hypothetical protein
VPEFRSLLSRQLLITRDPTVAPKLGMVGIGGVGNPCRAIRTGDRQKRLACVQAPVSLGSIEREVRLEKSNGEKKWLVGIF